MITHIISIDAGGSKTAACIEPLDGSARYSATGAAASLSHKLDQSCEIIIGLANELLALAKVKPQQCQIVCGAAGAACEQNRQVLQHHLGAKWAGISIHSDAQTSLYGAGQGQPLVVIAIGTGSVAMRLNSDGSEQMFGGWGFVAGDLGSGACMGRLAVSRSLVGLDQGLAHSDPLMQAIAQQMGVVIPLKLTARQVILDWLKNSGATQYAAIAPRIFDLSKTSRLAKDIILQAAQSIEELIDCAQGINPLKVALIGGLAYKLEPYLSAKYQAMLVAAKGDALDGGLYIARQILRPMGQ
ncbi:MAG: BadF/BadG/BcrA/BcrD ATPase family protein [Enterobacterales bacterium]|nr:BadF/BadG/BcrA/BcrD ATPase family protein [Enterobacterales bacterium]